MHLQEVTLGLHVFLSESGITGAFSVLGVVVSALSSLTKRYLLMEEAAASASDRLVDLTSRDGDWFLDELCSMSGNVNHLLGLLQHTALVCVTSTKLSCLIEFFSVGEYCQHLRDIYQHPCYDVNPRCLPCPSGVFMVELSPIVLLRLFLISGFKHQLPQYHSP
jgi:hypothetical protein